MGIKGIALLSPFSLTNLVCRALIVHGTQAFQHRHTRNEVESADAIDRQHSGAFVQIRESLKSMCDTLGACLRGQRVLKWRHGPLNHL